LKPLLTLDKGINLLLKSFFNEMEEIMSQIIACKNKKGIILASDSKAVDFNLQGNMVEVSIRRICQLTTHTAIITGGSAAGEKMCQSLKDFVGQESLLDIEDVYNAALPFLASEYERFMRKACEYLPVDPINQVHFILAGYSAKDTKNPFQLYLLWTKKKLPLLDGDEISGAYSVPRLMSLEYQLGQLRKAKKNIDETLPQIKSHLERQSEINDEIAGPFSFAFITRDGFQTVK
jgi:hypothetical protein